MRTTPKITIITAAYNAVETIEQTISSVVHQDYPCLEYVIVDGASTDGTLEIIKRYAPYGIRWISEPDHGLYDALNKGVYMATGDYVEIIGADDALTATDIISRVVSSIDPETDILCAQEYFVDETERTQFPFTNLNARDKERYQGGMVPHAAMFVRKELLLRYPFDTSYRIAGDYKFFLQCYYDDRVKIRYSDDMVAFFSVSGMSSNIEACWEENNRIYRELGLPFHAPDDISSTGFKRLLRKWIVKTGLFIPARQLWRLVDTKVQWKRHSCDNEICRWCGRTA